MVFGNTRAYRLPEHPNYPLHAWQQYAFSLFSRGLTLKRFVRETEPSSLIACIHGPRGSGTVRIEPPHTAYEQIRTEYATVLVSHPKRSSRTALTLQMSGSILEIGGKGTRLLDLTAPGSQRQLHIRTAYARAQYTGRVERPPTRSD